MPTELSPRLMSWASEVDDVTINQAFRTAALPIIAGHVALMPDAHLGIGSTVGSVIPTDGAVIPSAVGVDIGCGMIATELDFTASQLPDDLTLLLHRIGTVVPAGLARGHRGRDVVATTTKQRAKAWFNAHEPATELSKDQRSKAVEQFGSLGSGNHFLEVCLDERDHVWIMLHSGSRGIGNQLAQGHISRARKLAKHLDASLRDPDLAWFLQGTAEFDAYLADMLWAQDYALANREQMMDATLAVVFKLLGPGREIGRVNCHHNFCVPETHVVDGSARDLWITRKGAIRARAGELGIIPGSMGTKSYIVRGHGNPLSWNSCSHGAGRRLSRTAAKKKYTADDLTRLMGDRMWQADKADSLIDEIPAAYKDIDQVMADQTDLVEVVHTLRQVLNYKGC